MNPWTHINIKNNILHMNEINLSDIVDKYSTPLYVVSSDRLIEKYRQLKDAFEDYKNETIIIFAYKANSHLAVCRTLSNVDCGADVVSRGELDVAKKIQVDPKKIVFNGNNKTIDELKLASESNLLMVNVDSFSEIEKIKKLNLPLNVAVRVNPNVDAKVHKHVAVGLKESKFGIDIEGGCALKAYKKLSECKNVSIKGIHCHIGSQIKEVDPFVSACEKLIDLSKEIKDKLSIEIEYLNLGGGIGVASKVDDKIVTFQEYAKRIKETIYSKCKQHNLKTPKLILEPGRSIAADSTLLLGKVGTIKKKDSINWASLDTGMTHLMRPALYGAYHYMQVVNDTNRSKKEKYSMAGPCCESGDFLAKDRELTSLKEGDIIAIYNSGAYGFTMSHNYNLQYRPKVIMLHKEKDYLIREREDFDYLYKLEKIPDVLLDVY